MVDVIIIGAGPAGLNAALVLGRSRKSTIIFDDDRPRNAVTQESHGFITRDGTSPKEFRQLGRQELKQYPTITIKNEHIQSVQKMDNVFHVTSVTGVTYRSKKVILATGLKDVLPSVPKIQEYYGRSLFVCPFCDGWELRDQPLAIISEEPSSTHMVQMLFNWSRDLALFTNGRPLKPELKEEMQRKGIPFYEQIISELKGIHGQLEAVILPDGTAVKRSGGFIGVQQKQASDFAQQLGCQMNEMGAIQTDDFGRTTISGLFACGDTSYIAPSQLIIAAADGSKAAIGIVADMLVESDS
ncbi:NAD(P)/FAD-dependent oxidoreductase [Alkalihalobacillus pseudalcaliphilus]|uniref:NAD(P)/FAD-dependent oxidoreductase n=1 Tax=Alkalihalobacillus pseudalcaliphilus TaxID=79884 RepID=UPI00064E04B0|nr:NAD(P)/FAD-dependent oxidoreductase [Alkalihalobacillus pseudalcaliphilus]KMK75830.1 pyridine nucleotide-disulfide oxidoreductase [Alkalihalobacillus pseudalcaliphilus]